MLSLCGVLLVSRDPEMGAPNLPNQGVHFVTRNPPNEQKTDRWDVQPVARMLDFEARH